MKIKLFLFNILADFLLVMADDASNSDLSHEVVHEGSSKKIIQQHESSNKRVNFFIPSCIDDEGNYIPDCGTEVTADQCPARSCNLHKGSANGPQKVQVDPCTAENAAKFCSDYFLNWTKRTCDGNKDIQCACVGTLTRYNFTWSAKSNGCYVACNGRYEGSCKPINDIETEDDNNNNNAVCPTYKCDATSSRTRVLNAEELGGRSCEDFGKALNEGKIDDVWANYTKTLDEIKKEAQNEANLKCNPLTGVKEPCFCQGPFSADTGIVIAIIIPGGGCQVEFKASLSGQCSSKVIIGKPKEIIEIPEKDTDNP